jgi:hypothetical protein
LYVDENNHVQKGDAGNYFKPNGQPAKLKHAPNGWKDTLVKYARNVKYWGLFRDYSVPMNFVGDGRRILRDQFYKYGVEAVVYMGIAKLDRSSVPYNYTSWYVSELDFTKYEETKTGVKIMAVEGGLTKFIKANEGTEYEIPIDTDLEKVFVKHDGVVLTEKANYKVLEDFSISKVDYGTDFFMPFLLSNREGHSTGITFQNAEIEDTSGTTYADKLASPNWFAKAADNNSGPITLRLDGTLTFTCTQNDPGLFFLMRFLRSNLDIADQNDYRFFDPTTLVAGQKYVVDVDIDIVLEPGERLYFESHFETGGVDIKVTFDPSNHIALEYEGRYRTTYVGGLYPYRVLEVLLQKMTGGLYTANSPWLEAKRDIILTSGNSIRGIRYIDTLVSNTIKTSLSQFFQWLVATCSVGLTVANDQLVIDELANFFTDDVTADLGEVDDIVITAAEDISFNTVKVGYKEQDYNDVNGKYEFNQGQQWTTPKTRDVKELDLVSPYRADPIGMELLRINYENLTTTDAKEDNDVFALNVEETTEVFTQTVDFVAAGNYMTNPEGYPYTAGNVVRIAGSTSNNLDFVVVGVGVNIVQFDTPVTVTDESAATITVTFLQGGSFELNRPVFSDLSGIPETMESSIYNVLLSPKTNLLNNGGRIHPVLDFMDAKKMTLASADRNKELSRTLVGVTIDEDADIQIGNLADKLFKPYYISLRTKVPLNVIELINANPFGKISFTVYGETYYMFLWDGGIAPAKAGKDNDAQTWKGLSAPENILGEIYDY